MPLAHMPAGGKRHRRGQQWCSRSTCLRMLLRQPIHHRLLYPNPNALGVRPTTIEDDFPHCTDDATYRATNAPCKCPSRAASGWESLSDAKLGTLTLPHKTRKRVGQRVQVIESMVIPKTHDRSTMSTNKL